MNQEITRTEHSVSARQFTVLLSPTRRAARLARLLTTAHLGSWGLPSEAAAQVVAELANNAVLHGRVSGRDFRLNLTVHDDESLLRIEVTDTLGEQVPPMPGGTAMPGHDNEAGRGLLIVEAFADRWGVITGPVPRKTIWAEITLVRWPADRVAAGRDAAPHEVKGF